MTEREWLLLPLFRTSRTQAENLAKGIGWILREGTAFLQEFQPHGPEDKVQGKIPRMQD